MASPPSPHSSCGSTEPNDDNNHNNNDDDNNNINNINNNNHHNNNNNHNHNNNNNNNNAPSLVLVGCPHCLMYLMISEDNLKCPKCKIINFIHFT
ncbi:hypothetical protein JHK87_043035 [Glycine soja]|nr:hypothetical protein JHK87_043035 [Glycine soja]